MRKTVSLLASMALAVLVACGVAALAAGPGVGQTATVTLVGAGDIASCSQNNDSATAKLLGNIPGTVFTLGDNVYPSGTITQYAKCYDPTWGRHKARTKPTLGNHDYNTNGSSAYFNYFGARAGARGKGYYSYDRGAWHIVALNSNCDKVGGCGIDSPQGRWLRNDLANNPSRCTLAYFHDPLYASGTGSNAPEVKPFWNTLYNRGGEIILAGNAHRYERYAKITPGGARSAKGIRQFIVGTGGEPGGDYNGPDHPDMQVMKRNTPGVLKLNLRADSYAWKFVPVAGKTFTDSGTDPCH
jgi:calcineurin-like phosphoesterase family protein